jgi:hypothetical protein
LNQTNGKGGNGGTNTGGGGGGMGISVITAGTGGSGSVHIRYPGTAALATGGIVSISGGLVVHSFYSSGNFITNA